jgi:hypothetical protein
VASKRGKLEAQITVPDGGWSVSATNGAGGPTTVTLAAGTYYPTDMITSFVAALEAGRPSGWTGSGSFGESGTGLVSLHCTSTPWSISWTSTDLRDALGFTGNISGVSAQQTGTRNAIGVWLPDCPMWHPTGHASDYGQRNSDMRYTRSPSGYVKSLVANRYVALKGPRWDYVTAARARMGRESVTGESAEYFWRNAHTGTLSYITAGAYVRLHLDADSATAGEYKIISWQTSPGTVSINDWSSLWRVEIPEMIKKPAATD